MAALTEVPIASLSPARFEEVLAAEVGRDFLEQAAEATRALEGRVVWNINSTARGGGVAEMLQSLLAYARGADVDARWLTIGGDPEFFRVTKRLHNRLHANPGDGGPLGPAEQDAYRRVLSAAADELSGLVAAGDIVVVHDPQPAGLCQTLTELGAKVVWRCHVGIDAPNELTREAWDFLRPHVIPADAYVFSRETFVWEDLEDAKVEVIAPSIDAFSAKNQELTEDAVAAILATTGLVAGDATGPARFTREDGTPGRVDRRASVTEVAPVPPGAPIVTQVSRWDRLKDPVGVIVGFAEHVPTDSGAHLIYAGPEVAAVSDDPEGAEVLAEATAAWEGLGDQDRARIHLAALPMADSEENAAMVNALQRRATVVVQKSLAEGFGLTVAEAMWKGRPVVASRIGGIQDQITDGETGVLLEDASDLTAYGGAVAGLLAEPERAEGLGTAARERVRDRFLASRHLVQYIDLFERLS